MPAGNSGERALEPPSWPPEPVLRDHFAILGNWRSSRERPGSVQTAGASLRLPRPGVSCGRPHSQTAGWLPSPWLASAVGFAVRPAPRVTPSALSRCTSGSPAAAGLLEGSVCWMESPEWGSGPWRDSVHPVPASPAGHHRASLHVAAAPTPSLPHSPPARNFLPSFLQTPPAGLCSVTSERPPSRRHFATLRAWWDWGSGHKEKTLLTSPGPRHVRSSRRAETRQSAPRFQSLLRPAEAGRPSLHRLMSLGARPCPPAPGEVSLLLGECPHGLPVIRLPPGTLALCSRPSLPLWVPSSRSSTGRPPSQPPGPDLRVSPRRCYPGSLSFGPCSCSSPLCLPHHTLLQASCLRVDRTLSGVVVD